VSYGTTAGAQLSFDLRHFFLIGGASLYGFILFHEVLAHPASMGLQRLADLVGSGALKPYIEVETNWNEIGPLAARLLERDFAGKAVLHTSKTA
jgi:NADPH:quinone reductase-like Zn-dependent oxidoreductase